MKQTSLFDFALEEYEKEIEEQPKEEPKEQTDYRKYNVCPKCKVYPVERKTRIKTIEGYFTRGTAIICPICGYHVHTIHDPYEHWNICNYYRVRDGKI